MLKLLAALSAYFAAVPSRTAELAKAADAALTQVKAVTGDLSISEKLGYRFEGAPAIAENLSESGLEALRDYMTAVMNLYDYQESLNPNETARRDNEKRRINMNIALIGLADVNSLRDTIGNLNHQIKEMRNTEKASPEGKAEKCEKQLQALNIKSDKLEKENAKLKSEKKETKGDQVKRLEAKIDEYEDIIGKQKEELEKTKANDLPDAQTDLMAMIQQKDADLEELRLQIEKFENGIEDDSDGDDKKAWYEQWWVWLIIWGATLGIAIGIFLVVWSL